MDVIQELPTAKRCLHVCHSNKFSLIQYSYLFCLLIPLVFRNISKICAFNRIIEWKPIMTKSMEMTNFEFSIGISSCFNFIHYIIDNRINPQHNRKPSRY
jgi:hypothetical protein